MKNRIASFTGAAFTCLALAGCAEEPKRSPVTRYHASPSGFSVLLDGVYNGVKSPELVDDGNDSSLDRVVYFDNGSRVEIRRDSGKFAAFMPLYDAERAKYRRRFDAVLADSRAAAQEGGSSDEMYELLRKLDREADLIQAKPSETGPAKQGIIKTWARKIVSPPERHIRKCPSFTQNRMISRIGLGEGESTEALVGKNGVLIGSAARYTVEDKTSRFFMYRGMDDWEKELVKKAVEARLGKPVRGEFDNIPGNCN